MTHFGKWIDGINQETHFIGMVKCFIGGFVVACPGMHGEPENLSLNIDEVDCPECVNRYREWTEEDEDE